MSGLRVCPAERVTQRVVRFLADEHKVWGARRRVTTHLGINRFCALSDGEQAPKDLTFTIRLASALGFDAADVLALAAQSDSFEAMQSALRAKVSSRGLDAAERTRLRA
jgi:hypothetical protein